MPSSPLTIYPVVAGSGNTLKNATSQSAARANNANSVVTTGNFVPDYEVDGSNNYVYRSFQPWLISDLVGATILGVKYSAKAVYDMIQGAHSYSFNIYPSSQASPTGLAVTDHAAFTNTKFCDTNILALSAGVFVEWVFNAAGIAALQAAIAGGTGYFKTVLMETNDAENNGISSRNTQCSFYAPWTANDTDKPKLEITFSLLPAAGNVIFI